MTAKDWTEHLGAQDRVIARRQALAGGMSAEAWEWRLKTGVWQPVVRGVAIAHSGPPTARQLCIAAVLHGGRGCALSGDARLMLRGFTGLDLETIDLAIPVSRRVVGCTLTHGPRVVVHTVTGALRWQLEVDGLSMIRVPGAVLQAAAWAKSDRAAEWRIAAAVQQRLTVVPQLREALADMPKLRRRALIRQVLDDVELGAHAASELEFLRFCRSHRIPLPDVLQVRVRAGGLRYLDGRWVRQRVSLELDGAHHLEAKHWEADALRSLHLAVAARGTGEQLLRLTTANLRQDGAVVAGLLRSLLL